MGPTPLSQAQVDAVLAHLSAEYDAAEAFARAQNYGFWNPSNYGDELGAAIHAAKLNNLRALTAAAERHPLAFESLAVGAEKDLRQMAGYTQTATVAQVLKDTASATAAQVQNAVEEAAGFTWALVPWWAKAGAAVAAVAVAWWYVRPLFRQRAAA